MNLSESSDPTHAAICPLADRWESRWAEEGGFPRPTPGGAQSTIILHLQII